MSEVSTGGGEQPKKGKAKKIETRVDFTPMVDMNMLLITFFMFCTSMSKPQTMEIVMPTNDKDIKEQDMNKVKQSKAITVILGSDNKVYYYLGKPNLSDPSTLKEANYGGAEDPKSLRSLLLSRNKVGVERVRQLKLLKYKKQISEADFKKGIDDVKEAKDGQTVIIKPTDESTYVNLVDVLDEMAICSIGKYTINTIEKGDEFLIAESEKKSSNTKPTK